MDNASVDEEWCSCLLLRMGVVVAEGRRPVGLVIEADKVPANLEAIAVQRGIAEGPGQHYCPEHAESLGSFSAYSALGSDAVCRGGSAGRFLHGFQNFYLLL